MKAEVKYDSNGARLKITYNEYDEFGDKIEKSINVKLHKSEEDSGAFIVKCSRDAVFNLTDLINRLGQNV